MRIERTTKALQDIEDCIFWSAKNFGRQAAYRYKVLVETSIREISADPDLIGCRALDGFDPEIRIYHLRHSRKRADVGGVIVKKPKHFIAYQVLGDSIVVVRVLHDQRDIERHL